MKALSAQSKFLGVYDGFRMLVRNYGLKWSAGNGDDLVISRLTKTVGGDKVLDWIRKVKADVPDYAVFMDLTAATGLRHCEAVNSWNLAIQLAKENALNEYYKPDREVLEHYRYKQLFIRRSKKVFVSSVPDNLVEEAAVGKPLTVNLFPNRIRRRGLRRRFGDVREYHATVLEEHFRQP